MKERTCRYGYPVVDFETIIHHSLSVASISSRHLSLELLTTRFTSDTEPYVRSDDTDIDTDCSSTADSDQSDACHSDVGAPDELPMKFPYHS